MWFSHQNMSIDDDNNAYATIMANILEICKNGCTKDKIVQKTDLSHNQLRRITTEMVDIYITLRDVVHILQQIRGTYFLMTENSSNNQMPWITKLRPEKNY